MDKPHQSYSPPAPAHCSPPLSPTITQLSSRSPTPSPTDHHEDPQDILSCPPNATTDTSFLGEVLSPPGSPQGELHAALLERPTPVSSASAPAGKIPQINLQDFSRYADSGAPAVASAPSSTSLPELTHLLRLQVYQEKRRSRIHTRLHGGLISVSLSTRLKNCNELAFRSLVDNFRSDDKKGFASLYNAVQDVRRSCEATWRHAGLGLDIRLGETNRKSVDASPNSTFMHQLPGWIREDLLNFLSLIRTDSDFLASRIASLSPSELASMTAFHQSLDTIDSVMPSQSRGRPLGYRSNRNSAFLPTPVERLLSFQRHDPLSALLHTVFAPSEDLQRLEIWSTTCAKVITEGKSGGEQFVCSVFNAWASMQEWPFKPNLEMYLMQILQESSCLLEGTNEQLSGPKGPTELRNAKDAIALEDFFDKALERLFDILDGEPSRAAIPPGVIKLCHAILRKVKEPKKQLAAEIFIVSKWFFSTFLLNSIICPESHGIMLGYHISEIARQKILRELAVRASKQVVDLTSHWRQPVPVLPETRNHIEHIFSLIRWSESKDIRPTILPTSSVLPSQDTSDNQPYIVVSPTDLITLVKTLFPETHQASPFTEVDGQPSGLRSRASSVSAVSSSIHANSRSHRGFDSVSVLSTSGSSMTSDTTSREPLLDTLGQQVEQSISTLKRTSRQNLRSAYSESESKVAQGFGQKLRLSCSEMSRILGHNAMAGTCHPCAEQWAVLYAINDGMQLSIETDMIEVENVDDEGYDDESSDDGNGNEQNFHSLNFGRDYHQLKEAIAKLLTESYLPEEFTLQSNGEHFSNRISIHRKRDRHIAPLGFTARRSVPFASRNPYYTQNQPSELVVESPRNDKNISRALVDEQRACHSETREIDEGPKLTIESMLEMALNRSQDQDDFVTAHYWWTTLQQLRRVSSNSLTRDGYGPLLHYFSREARESLRECGSAIEASEAWLVWIRQTRDRQEILAGKKFKDLGTLRDKMWYVTDVKNSSPYEKTRNIAMALKKMARPLRLPQSKPHSTSRPRNMPRSSTGTFTNNTETQFFEIMAASREQGGPNKLADGQADKTQKWLMQSGVENFCKGEERIHRFCLEIQECVDKLVGEHMLDSPVLWSSELYYREKDLYEDSSRNSTLDIPGIATPGSREFELSFVRPRSQGHSFLPRPGQEIYAVSGRNTSQQSFQSARWNTSRDSNATHRGDFQDYLGSGSPILTIDSSATFWSPYETQGRRPESSSRSRPATAPSMNETRMSENADNTSRKRLTFLSDLKQKLTNLILSDLGTTLWSRGSETDAWFSGDLGEECMHKKLTDSAYGKKMTEIPSIRSTNAPDISWDPSVSEERCRTSMAFLTRLSPPLHDANSETVSEVQQIADLSNSNRQLNAGAIPGYKRQFKFPYRTAYRRLLGTFSTHPSPLMKLQALYDLELLIIAFLTSDPRHSQHSQHSTVTFGSESPTSGTVPRSRTRGINVPMTRATRLEEVIANCEERRFNTIALAKRSSISHRSHPTGPPKRAPSTDMIVDMIQELLRDGDIRPKTLFRDLQYIAAFVPADILDKTERGKAFWDVGLAALGLKQDVCRTMVEIADGVVAHHTNKRSQIRPVQGADTEGLARFGMEDAARMWMITAKEGDPVAERELAIFYLTHPELLPRIMLPLTMPRDTFKAEMMYRRIEDPARSDPQTMCVAIHWMELSANGGDKLAKKYLRQRDELNALP